jgi:hypothetical protein
VKPRLERILLGWLMTVLGLVLDRRLRRAKNSR